MIDRQTGQNPLPSLTSALRPRRRLLRAEGYPPWLAGAIWRRRLTSGFTLIEIVVVIAIIVVLMAIIAPAFTSLKTAGDVTSAAYTIKGALDQARTYAQANNTYTWVGFFEEDGSQPSTNPATAGAGRIVMSIVASKDGTMLYTGNLSNAVILDPPNSA